MARGTDEQCCRWIEIGGRINVAEKMHGVFKLKSAALSAQRGFFRSLTRDRKFDGRKVLPELRHCLKKKIETFFLGQAADGKQMGSGAGPRRGGEGWMEQVNSTSRGLGRTARRWRGVPVEARRSSDMDCDWQITWSARR